MLERTRPAEAEGRQTGRARHFGSAGRIFYVLTVSSLFMIMSLYTVHGFLLHWSLREGDERFGFEKMLDGSAERPFVYRQLVPAMVKAVDGRYALASVDRKPIGRYTDICLSASWICGKYVLTVYIMITALFSSMWMMLLLGVGYQWPPHLTVLAPTLFVALLPLTFNYGGYFYDFVELLLVFASAVCVQRKHLALFAVVAVLAVLNKESDLLLPLVLMPFLVKSFGWRRGMGTAMAALALLSLPYAAIKLMYAGNPGQGLEWHFSENLTFWMSSAPYLRMTWERYLPGWMSAGGVANVLIAPVVAWLVAWRWREKPVEVRYGLYAAALVSLPLWVVFGFKDEVRALALMYPAVFLACGHTMQSWDARA